MMRYSQYHWKQDALTKLPKTNTEWENQLWRCFFFFS